MAELLGMATHYNEDIRAYEPLEAKRAAHIDAELKAIAKRLQKLGAPAKPQ